MSGENVSRKITVGEVVEYDAHGVLRTLRDATIRKTATVLSRKAGFWSVTILANVAITAFLIMASIAPALADPCLDGCRFRGRLCFLIHHIPYVEFCLDRLLDCAKDCRIGSVLLRPDLIPAVPICDGLPGHPGCDVSGKQRSFPSVGTAFCSADQKNVELRVINVGDADAPPFNVEVTFDVGTSSQTAVIHEVSGGLSLSVKSIVLLFPIPVGCFAPDCFFRIEVDPGNLAGESDTRNNVPKNPDRPDQDLVTHCIG